MKRRILLSGDRSEFTTLEFDDVKGSLNILAHYSAPYNASWVERSSSYGEVDGLVGLSEGEDAGLLYTFEINHSQKASIITSCLPTLGAPGHFATLHDDSAIALITYLGGSIALYPKTAGATKEVLLESLPRTELFLDFPYKSTGHGPDPSRQRQCHPHQIIETRSGLLYVPDLGSDRVWVVRRDKMKLEVSGWLQCPSGTGPRHAVLCAHEHLMYVIGELSHTVIAFDISGSPSDGVQPIPTFAANVIPPSVAPGHQSQMDSSEICSHPKIPNVLYVSNRWEKHIARREPYLEDVPTKLPSGDAIAIILLSGDGRSVSEIKHIRTAVDVIRGMRLSEDGRYVVVLGQEDGDVEIYEITGNRGDSWKLVTSLSGCLDAGLKHVVWL
ncbi:putative isomerase YbhE [Pyrenochaeta sp. DS3sAY3a]|nr:putative isomerase YbhE [Pyrenochaeta sp. DS3sAY3a]